MHGDKRDVSVSALHTSTLTVCLYGQLVCCVPIVQRPILYVFERQRIDEIDFSLWAQPSTVYMVILSDVLKQEDSRRFSHEPENKRIVLWSSTCRSLFLHSAPDVNNKVNVYTEIATCRNALYFFHKIMHAKQIPCKNLISPFRIIKSKSRRKWITYLTRAPCLRWDVSRN